MFVRLDAVNFSEVGAFVVDRARERDPGKEDQVGRKEEDDGEESEGYAFTAKDRAHQAHHRGSQDMTGSRRG